MIKKTEEHINKAAIKAVALAMDAVNDLIVAKGEEPSSALLIGYMSMITTRITDDLSQEEDE